MPKTNIPLSATLHDPTIWKEKVKIYYNQYENNANQA